MSDEPNFLSRRYAINKYALESKHISFSEIKFQKVEILAAILNHMEVDLQATYFSSGSTVTRAGLQKMCESICGVDASSYSKKKCLELSLEHLGYSDGIEDYFLSPGSTITKNALMKIYQLILRD